MVSVPSRRGVANVDDLPDCGADICVSPPEDAKGEFKGMKGTV